MRNCENEKLILLSDISRSLAEISNVLKKPTEIEVKDITEAVKKYDKQYLENVKISDTGEISLIDTKDEKEYSLSELAQFVGIALFDDLKEYRKSNDVEHILGTEIMALNALTNVARLSKDLNS